MLYTSTRNKQLKVSSAEAITKGISEDGGLFVPCEIPRVSLDFIASLGELSYTDRAVEVLKLYLTDFTEEELTSFAKGAYEGGKFASRDTAPVVQLHDNVNILELWHGPTCAFKDMALQLLPHLLMGSAKKTLKDKEIVILVATSGDTGKAALEGFKDVAGTKILVFYPNDGVSPMQKRQMCTQEGENVGVCAVNGNFDDAQTGVKAIFTDREIKKVFDENALVFSSANSINWGRLVPQIVYYFSAYADMLNQKKIALGDKINIVVPTGNFGNILAAHYAMKMGLPVNRLICASNANRVLTDFITTGEYNKDRAFYTTISPSMDILISSNLERLIFNICGSDEQVKSLYAQLKDEGSFRVSDSTLREIDSVFSAGCCDDDATKEAIRSAYENYGYLCDTHTAVAIKVYEDYRATSGDETPTVIASTASPYKFCASVLSAVAPGSDTGDEFSMVEELESKTGTSAPPQLKGLKDKKERFSGVCEKDADSMRRVVFRMLGIE